MKLRHLPTLLVALLLPLLACASTVVTTKKTSLALANGSIGLPKDTKLELLGVEGDHLLVKYRAASGRVPTTDTNYDAEKTAAPVAETPKSVAATETKPATPAPAVAPAPANPVPPALSLDQKPATNYGKAVQKAKQVEQAHNDKLVKPADEILGK